MSSSILKQMTQSAPLRTQIKLKGSDASFKKEKSLFFSLNLTTLIDAFCILVIFLLSNMNGRIQTIQDNQKIALPTAIKTESLDQGLVVRIQQDEIFINDKKIDSRELTKELLSAKKSDVVSLIIQADRQIQYENIALVLRAGGVAGYEKYIFAVLPGT